jgi:hypothetical protein
MHERQPGFFHKNATRLGQVLAAMLRAHLLQRYAATGDETLHSYPATLDLPLRIG